MSNATNIWIPPSSAAPLFDAGQKAFYVTSSLAYVLCAFYVWRVASRRLEKDERLVRRLQNMYNALCACVFAVFVCVAVPRSTMGMYTWVYAVATIGIVTGFLFMLTCFSCGRVWHSNANWTAPANHVYETQEALIDQNRMQSNDYVGITDLNTFSDHYVASQDKQKDQNQRFFTFFMLYVVIMFMTGTDGLFLVYWADKTLVWPMLVASFIVRFAYSVIVYSALVHATIIHMDYRERWYRRFYSYGAFVAYHFAALVCAAVPMWIDMTTEDAAYVLRQIPFTLAYGVCSGVLLWFMTYYIWIHDVEMSKRDVRVRLVVITGVSIVVSVAGLFV